MSPMSHPAQSDHPAALTLHRLCGQLSLLVWEGTVPANIRRLRVLVDGKAVKPPFTHISLRLPEGRSRSIIAVGSIARSPIPTIELIEPDRTVVATCAQVAVPWGHADDLDVCALVTGLAGQERARLARFLIEVCSFLFRVSADPTLVAHIRTMLLEITSGAGQLTPRCALTGTHVLCEAIVPAALGQRLSAVWLAAGGVHRLALPIRRLDVDHQRPDMLGLGVVLECLPADARGEIVVFGDGGLVRRKLVGIPPRLPDASAWLTQLSENQPRHRHYLLDSLARLGASDDRAKSLLRELLLLTPRTRSSSPGHGCLAATANVIVGCKNGVFVSGSLRDPHGLVETLVLESDDQARVIAMNDLVFFDAPQTAKAASENGFSFFLSERDGWARSINAPVRLSVGLRSGARVPFAEDLAVTTPEQARDAILSSMPPGRISNSVVFDCIEPALDSVFREWTSLPAPGFDAIDVGALPGHPSATVILPFIADPDIVRCRAGLFSLDATMADVEVLYVAESAEQCRVARQMLGNLQPAYGSASRIIVPQRTLPNGALLNGALRSARGPFVAFLGADVLPEAPAWLLKLLCFLKGQPQHGIVGGHILNEDHSLVAAGLYIGADAEGRWALRPRLSGFPRDYPAASIPTRAAALPADCLVISRALLEKVGGLADDYLLSDSAGVDLCLRVRSQGREVCRLPEPALFRASLPLAGALNAHHAACAELDRRKLEKRWRASLETEGAAFRRSTLMPRAIAGEGSAPAKRVA